MSPHQHLIQFETRRIEIDAALGLYGEREAGAQRALAEARTRRRLRRWPARVLASSLRLS